MEKDSFSQHHEQKAPKRQSNLSLELILKKVLRVAGYGFLIRLCFSLIGARLNVLKILTWKNGILKGILKFALMCGLFSFNYKFTHFILEKSDVLKHSKDRRVFVAALMSSTALFLAQRGDYELLKVLIVPRAFEAIYALLVERGVITPIKHGETMVAILAALAIAYSYIYEPANVSFSFVRQLDKYCDLSKGERQLFDMMRVVVADDIKKYYRAK